jgi:hypothetical protein
MTGRALLQGLAQGRHGPPQIADLGAGRQEFLIVISG